MYLFLACVIIVNEFVNSARIRHRQHKAADVRFGGEELEAPSHAKDIVKAVQSVVNSIRSKQCPDRAHIIVRSREPCEVQVVAGVMETCWMEFSEEGGHSSVAHKVHGVHVPDGGFELYVEFPEEARSALEKQRWCEIIIRSPGHGEALHAANTSFLETAMKGWAGHQAELEFMKRTNGSHEAYVALSHGVPEYGQDLPPTFPDEWSVRTGFNSGKAGARSSGHCFPRDGSNVVTNQGDCGSCWAQAASAVVSDRMCLAGVKGFEAVNALGKLADRTLSVQHVMSCGTNTDGCMGGEMSAFFHFAATQGVARRAEWPYQMKCPKMKTELPLDLVAPKEYGIDCSKFQGTKLDDSPSLSSTPCVCLKGRVEHLESQPPCDMSKITEVFKIDDFKRTPFVSEVVNLPGMGAKQFTVDDAVTFYMAELYTNGPFGVGFHTYNDFQPATGNPYNPKMVYIKSPHALHQGAHAVALLGWGQRMQNPYPWQCLPAQMFMNNMTRFWAANPVPPNPGTPAISAQTGFMPTSPVPDHLNYICAPQLVPYWELRNSWGTRYGDKGHFYMRRGTNEVGIESTGFMPHVSVRTAGPHAKTAPGQVRQHVADSESSGRASGKTKPPVELSQDPEAGIIPSLTIDNANQRSDRGRDRDVDIINDLVAGRLF